MGQVLKAEPLFHDAVPQHLAPENRPVTAEYKLYAIARCAIGRGLRVCNTAP